MKQKETLLTTPLSKANIELSHLIIEEMGDEHKGSSPETPLRADAFEKTDEEKIEAIEPHFKAIMEILGLDLNDDSLMGTPQRVAKMYVKELFQGLNPANMPSMTLFENKFQYNEMLVEKNINFYIEFVLYIFIFRHFKNYHIVRQILLAINACQTPLLLMI